LSFLLPVSFQSADALPQGRSLTLVTGVRVAGPIVFTDGTKGTFAAMSVACVPSTAVKIRNRTAKDGDA
jgi:hypothetical protein